MAFVAHAIVGDIDLDGKPSIEAIKAVAGESGKMKQTVENNAKQAAAGMSSTFKSSLGDLKANFGKSSLLGQGLKLAAGGGAIMALSIGINKLDEAIKGAADLKQQFAEGKVNAFDVGENVAKMIPVFGEVYTLGRDIRATWTGEAAEIAEANNRVKEQAEGWDRVEQIVKQTKAAAKGFGDEIRDAKNQLELMLAAEGPARERVQIEQEKNTALRNNDAVHDPKEFAGKIAEAQKRANDLDSQLAAKNHEIETIRQNNQSRGASSDSDPQIAADQSEILKITERRTQALQEVKKLQASQTDLVKKQAEARTQIEAVAAEKIRQLQEKSIAEVKADHEEVVRRYNEMKAQASAPLADAQKQVDQAGMTDHQKKIDDMKRSGLFLPEELKAADEVFSKFDKSQGVEKLKEAAKALHESLESPAEKLQETIAKYQDMLKNNLISQEDYDRATMLASKESIDAAGPTSGAALLRSGSAQSQAAAYGNKYDKNAVMESLAKQQLAQLQVIAKHNEALAGHTTEAPDTIHDMAGIA